MEFGLIAIPLAALMVAILQTSLTFFAQQTLETTAERSVRTLMIGSAQKGNMTAAQFKTLVCSKLSSFMKCSNVLVDVRSATAFSAANTDSPAITYDASGNINNTWAYSPGGAGSINVAKIMYVWNVAPGPLGFNISNMTQSRRLLVATEVFKTEPYE